MMSQIAPGTETTLNNTDLFTLITQLAHYLKILIRITLTGSIKLERDCGNLTAMPNALARLNLLAMDNSDPATKKRGEHAGEPALKPIQANIENASGGTGDEEQLRRNIDALTRTPKGYIASTREVAYGYRSLAVSLSFSATLGFDLTSSPRSLAKRPYVDHWTNRTCHPKAVLIASWQSKKIASDTACSTAGILAVSFVSSVATEL